jgi:hypothetical protein
MCPPGKRPLGGGAHSGWLHIDQEGAVDGTGRLVGYAGTPFPGDRPFDPSDVKGWEATAFNGDFLGDFPIIVFAICAQV